jgi:hypothetical protein
MPRNRPPAASNGGNGERPKKPKNTLPRAESGKLAVWCVKNKERLENKWVHDIVVLAQTELFQSTRVITTDQMKDALKAAEVTFLQRRPPSVDTTKGPRRRRPDPGAGADRPGAHGVFEDQRD